MSLRVLVPGASGFIGKALCAELSRSGHSVTGVYRSLSNELRSDASVRSVVVPSFDGLTDWSEALRDIDIVVSLVSRVHVMREVAVNPIAEYRFINVQGTINIARQAASAGVRRFLFLSSIKVNGELTKAGQCFDVDDIPAPSDPYGISKYEAESALLQISKETGMEVVIIRPPLVYGPGVKGNFATMIQSLRSGIPLPLRAIQDNRRSMVALGNLIDLICTCIKHPAAANQVFLVSDGEDLSTAALLQRMANALGVQARLFSVSPVLLKFAAKLLGKELIHQRLCESLQINMTKTTELLKWVPPLTVDEGLRLAAMRDT